MKRRLGRVTKNWLGLIGVFICIAFAMNVLESGWIHALPWFLLAFMCAQRVMPDR